MVALRDLLGAALPWATCFATALGCRPNIEGRPSLIDRARVIAVQSFPAESAPRDVAKISYRALYASPVEDADPSGLEWAYCMTRKPITVIGPAALECYAPGGKGLVQLGTGLTAEGTIDKEDCAIFGPSPPVPEGDEPPSRPADPDVTGGYYQPVRVLVPTREEEDYVVGVTRLACGVSGATIEQSIEYNDRYRPNENPVIDAVDVTHAGGEKETFPAGDTVPEMNVKPGEAITMQINWSDCPTESTCGDGICGPSEYAADRMTMGEIQPGCPEDCEMPKGCTGSEPYVTLDPEVHEIIAHREAMRASWFATDGNYLHDRTGRTEDEVSRTYIDNDWVAPDRGTVHMWFVLRDARGGVGFTELVVHVEP